MRTQARHFQGARHGQFEGIEFEGLLQEIPGGMPHGVDRDRNCPVGGHDHERNLGTLFTDLLQEVQARGSGHLVVGQHEIDVV